MGAPRNFDQFQFLLWGLGQRIWINLSLYYGVAKDLVKLRFMLWGISQSICFYVIFFYETICLYVIGACKEIGSIWGYFMGAHNGIWINLSLCLQGLQGIWNNFGLYYGDFSELSLWALENCNFDLRRETDWWYQINYNISIILSIRICCKDGR